MLTYTFVINDLNYVRTYMQMFSGFGKSFKDKDNGINYADFPWGNNIFAFNLTLDLIDGPHFHLIHRSSVWLEI